MDGFKETGEILFIATGKLPINRCDELIALNAARDVVGKNRADVIGKYFIPGEGKLVMIFRAENLTQLLHALYRTPNIDWDVVPVSTLDDVAKAGPALRQDCLAELESASKDKEDFNKRVDHKM